MGYREHTKEAPFQANEMEGLRGELLALVQQLRKFVLISFDGCEMYYFASGALLGDASVEARLQHSLDARTHARILSSDSIDELLSDAPRVMHIILHWKLSHDEHLRHAEGSSSG